MTETIRCPGCSTRFVLTPERVHAGHRRAKCFKCETIFAIGEEVDRILGATPAEPPAPAEPPPPPPPPPTEPSVFAAFEPQAPPSLTLGDLEGSEEEIMEKTLVDIPSPQLDVPEPTEATSTGGFSSAKAAIAKLMADVPAAPPAGERRQMSNRNPMDVEATLSALEDTLSGAQSAPPPPLPQATASTMKLSAQEIQAAMASYGAANPPPPTFRTAAPPRAEVPPPPRPMEPPPTSQGSDLLKIQLEQETLSNVTIDQVTAWVEQGRVQEYHMVARQFSDHWIEAIKVPALRPVFDRKRRDDVGRPTEMPAPPPDLTPAKKSLFGGLFGRT